MSRPFSKYSGNSQINNQHLRTTAGSSQVHHRYERIRHSSLPDIADAEVSADFDHESFTQKSIVWLGKVGVHFDPFLSVLTSQSKQIEIARELRNTKRRGAGLACAEDFPHASDFKIPFSNFKAIRGFINRCQSLFRLFSAWLCKENAE